MTTTLFALAAVCLLSLAFILIIPHFAATKVLMSFLPQDIREAAKAHPDPSLGRQIIGYLMTALAAAAYVGLLFFLGAEFFDWLFIDTIWVALSDWWLIPGAEDLNDTWHSVHVKQWKMLQLIPFSVPLAAAAAGLYWLIGRML